MTILSKSNLKLHFEYIKGVGYYGNHRPPVYWGPAFFLTIYLVSRIIHQDLCDNHTNAL